MILYYTPKRNLCFSLSWGPDVCGTGFIRTQADFEFFAKVCGFDKKIGVAEPLRLDGYPALHVVLNQTDLMMIFDCQFFIVNLYLITKKFIFNL